MTLIDTRRFDPLALRRPTINMLLILSVAFAPGCAAPVVTQFDRHLAPAIVPQDGAQKAMRFIPGGWYARGARPPAGAVTDAMSFAAGQQPERHRPDESPGRPVGVSSFYLDETPVSYRDFAPYVRAAGGPRNHHWDYPIYNRPEQPVTGLNWYEAACYCNWRSVSLGLEPAYYDTGATDPYGYPVWERSDDAEGFRLPTEAEYEYAAGGRAFSGERRAPVATAYPWGDAFDRRLANYDEGRGVPRGRWWRLSKVRDQYRNGFGLYGTVGNVWEWNDDWYAPDAYDDADDTNPRGPSDPERFIKSMRGGSWGSFLPEDLRIRRRSYSAPGAYHFDVGFRCLLPAETAHRLQSESPANIADQASGPARQSSAQEATTNHPMAPLCRRPIASRLPEMSEVPAAVPEAAHAFSALDGMPRLFASGARSESATPVLERVFGENFRRRLANYLADYFYESVYFRAQVDGQAPLSPRELADSITDASLRYKVHPLFLTGIMRAESGMGTVSFPRWFNSPMAYHWQNAQMPNGLPQYRPGPGRNRKYRTLAAGFDAYARGVRQRFYIEAARGDLYRFHYIYVGYDAQEWMTALTTVYREVLGVNFTKNYPARDCGRLIYLDWEQIR